MRSTLPILIAPGQWVTAGLSWAQTVERTPTGQAGMSGSLFEPARLVIWNRPIVVFRVPVNQTSPAGRVATAIRRFDLLPDDVRGDEV